MSYELQVAQQGQELLGRDNRFSTRAVSHYRGRAVARVAASDAETDVLLAKMEAVTAAIGQASSSVARVGQLHQQLELMNPALSGQLVGLANIHQNLMGDLLAQFGRSLGRQ